MLSVITGTALCWLEHGASSAGQCDRDAAQEAALCQLCAADGSATLAGEPQQEASLGGTTVVHPQLLSS